jgi:hypothetical protein
MQYDLASRAGDWGIKCYILGGLHCHTRNDLVEASTRMLALIEVSLRSDEADETWSCVSSRPTLYTSCGKAYNCCTSADL